MRAGRVGRQIKLTLTKKIGLLLFLPFIISSVATLIYFSYLNGIRDYDHVLNIAGRQRMLATEMRVWTHMVAMGQEADRVGLINRVDEFDQVIKLMLVGGVIPGGNSVSSSVNGDQRRCQDCHVLRSADIARKSAIPQSELSNVVRLWNGLRRDILMITDAARGQPGFVESVQRSDKRLPELQELSNTLVLAIMERHRRDNDWLFSMMVISVVIAFLIFLFGLFISKHSIVRPILNVTRAAERIMNGDYSTRLDVVTHDELGTLADFFNRMTDQVAIQLAAIESVADPVFITDVGGSILWVNKAFVSQNGYTREDVTGKNPRILKSERTDRSEYVEMWRQILAGKSWKGEIINRRKNGSFYRALCTITPVIGSDGKPSHFISTCRDITERKNLQARMMQMDRIIAVGTLAAGVAHEINNPLAYVIANLEFLADAGRQGREQNPAELKAALAEAREGAERVRKIVLDLKVFSHEEEKEKHRESVSLCGVIESSINMAWNEIRHRARLVKDFGLLPLVEANEARLGQVFLNLLVNAAHAIPEGHVEENKISVIARTDEEGRAVIEVCDTGSGIPADVLPRIFDPFFTTKPVGQGTGLGLSICRNIVLEFGGDIDVESEIGKGTIFRVVLPPAREQRVASPASAPEPMADQPARRGRILIVDDEPAIGKAMWRILSREHEVVEAVTSAQAALDRLAVESFDIIFCDLMMPEMTGMDFYEEVCLRFPERAGRIIFLSGGAFTPQAREFIDRVPNLKMAKPVDTPTLRSIIREMLC